MNKAKWYGIGLINPISSSGSIPSLLSNFKWGAQHKGNGWFEPNPLHQFTNGLNVSGDVLSVIKFCLRVAEVVCLPKFIHNAAIVYRLGQMVFNH